MVPTFLACFVWLPALIGWGAFVLRLHGEANSSLNCPRRMGFCGLLGLLVMSVVGTTANFFIAIYPVLPIAGLFIGWGFLILEWQELFREIRRRDFLILIGLIAAVSLSAARGKIEYDTGLYHLAAVKWISSTPTPLGLANLYGRLGFNSAWFPAAAMLETPLLSGKSTFILNALLMVLFALMIVDAAEQVFRDGFKRADTFLSLAAYPWAVYGVFFSSSLHPDLAVMLLTCLVTSLWLGGEDGRRDVRMAVTFSVFAVTLKLSAVPLLAAAFAIWIWRGRRRTPASVVILWGVILLIWFIRGILLSGCLFYPSTVGRIGRLPWAVTVARIEVESASIRDWAKYHKLPWKIPAGEPWIGNWLKEMLGSQATIVALGVFVAGILMLGFNRRVARGAGWIILANGAGIVYWFLTAPVLRFGYGYVFSFAAIFFCMGLETPTFSVRGRKLLCGAGMILIVALSGYFQKLNHISWLRWPKVPSMAVVTRQVGDLTVYVPEIGDQIWAGPLPSTPYPDPALRYTVDGQGRFRRFWLDPVLSPMRVP